jgi:hypothetical protein
MFVDGWMDGWGVMGNKIYLKGNNYHRYYQI